MKRGRCRLTSVASASAARSPSTARRTRADTSAIEAEYRSHSLPKPAAVSGRSPP